MNNYRNSVLRKLNIELYSSARQDLLGAKAARVFQSRD